MDTLSSAGSRAGRYSIGEMCEAFGVTARALRFYEDEGLISPERRGTARVYSDRDRARLTWILRGKRVGFSLAEIRELLDLYQKSGQRAQMATALDRCRSRIGRLERQKRDIDATIADLERFCDILNDCLKAEG